MIEPIENCPLRSALTVLGGKWNMIIIHTIEHKKLRFGEIKREIPDISEKVLIEKLKVLADKKIVKRKDYKQIPPKVSYSLTKKGKQALHIIQQVQEFGEIV